MTYTETLNQLRGEIALPFAAGSAQEQAAIARFTAFFSDFSPDKIAKLLPQTYAKDVWFNDTLKTVVGREPLSHYLAESAAAVDACTVEVHDVTRGAQADYYVRWTMRIRFKKFKRGVDTYSIGISHLRFNPAGEVVMHQDFWDATQGLFEHVPVIGALIRLIKRRL